jgi:hypothetical protein
MKWVLAIVVVCAACGGSPNVPPPVEEMPATPMTYPVLADTLALGDVAIFQAVKVVLETDGASVTTRNAPVVAGRPAFVRVYVTPRDGWEEKTLDAELHLSVGGMETALLTDSKPITTASIDKTLTTTFNFTVDAGAMVSDVEYRVVARS